MTKPERIEYILKDRGYVMTKRELIELCPDISDTTIEITLGELLRSGIVEKIGGGRYTKYRYRRWVGENMEKSKKKPIKAYSYIRVSTAMQVEGFSVEAQRNKILKYA